MNLQTHAIVGICIGILCGMELIGCTAGNDLAGSTRTGNARVVGVAYLEGEAAKGATVKLCRSDYLRRKEYEERDRLKYETVSDHKGGFVFDSVQYGEYTCEITDSMGYGFVLMETIVSENSNGQIDLGDCSLQPGGTLSISIRSENLDPSLVIRIGIYGVDRSRETQPGRIVRFLDIPPGTYEVSVITSAPEITGSLRFTTEIASGELKWESGSLPIDYQIDSVMVMDYLSTQGIKASPWDRLVEEYRNRIWSLSLCNQNLSSLNPSIASLDFVSSLNLSGNPLQALPDTLISMANIKELILDSANVERLWPWVLRCTQLTRLRCRNNGLSMLPPDFDSLSQLQSLSLEDNAFLKFPREILSCRGLSDLNLTANNIDSIPPAIGQLARLEVFEIGANNIVSIPAQIEQCTALHRLAAWSNAISDFPAEFARLPNLQTLYLSGNRLRSIPEAIGDMESINRLSLNSNEIESLPESIMELQRLQYLDLRRNRLCTLSDTLEEWIVSRFGKDRLSDQQGCE